MGAGEHLLILTGDAVLSVARVSARGIELVRRYTVAESATWAHPLVMPNGVAIKDADSLALWGIS